MKKLIPTLLIIGAIPAGLVAYSGTYGNTHKSFGRQQQFSAIYDYDPSTDENTVDHYVTQDDKRIAKEIRSLFARSNMGSPDDVQIFVEYGKVILEGKADSNDHRQAAEDNASQVHGVRNVVNGLYVDNRQMQNPRGNNRQMQNQRNDNRQMQNQRGAQSKPGNS